MGRFLRGVRNIFKCSSRELEAHQLIQTQQVEYNKVVQKLDRSLEKANVAMAESRSAARSLLQRLMEDIPK